MSSSNTAGKAAELFTSVNAEPLFWIVKKDHAKKEQKVKVKNEQQRRYDPTRYNYTTQ